MKHFSNPFFYDSDFVDKATSTLLTKEEILDKYNWDLYKDDILKAMQEYSDQENFQLKVEIEKLRRNLIASESVGTQLAEHIASFNSANVALI